MNNYPDDFNQTAFNMHYDRKQNTSEQELLLEKTELARKMLDLDLKIESVYNTSNVRFIRKLEDEYFALDRRLTEVNRSLRGL